MTLHKLSIFRRALRRHIIAKEMKFELQKILKIGNLNQNLCGIQLQFRRNFDLRLESFLKGRIKEIIFPIKSK